MAITGRQEGPRAERRWVRVFDIPGLGVPELILLLVLALIIFGPGKLPDIGRSLGRAINEFKAASREITKDYAEEDSRPTRLPVIETASRESGSPEDGNKDGAGPR